MQAPKTNHEIFLELLKNNEPCCITYFMNKGSKTAYGAPFKVKWSKTVPDHLNLYNAIDDSYIGCYRESDPHIRYFNLDRIPKPGKSSVVKVTRSDGVTKEFFTAKEALEDGAVDDYVHIREVTLSSALDNILNDMDSEDYENKSGYKSLESLTAASYDSWVPLIEYYDVRCDPYLARHYIDFDVEANDSWYYTALNTIARTMGWEVSKEERYV